MLALKAMVRALTPPLIYDLAHAIKIKLKPKPLPQVNSGWIGLHAWPDIVPTWSYVLGKDNNAIEGAREDREEDRKGGDLGFTGSQSSELVRANMLAFAYACARAADGKTSFSVLDFGGGLGLYSTVARQALSEKSVDYTVQELPAIAKAGALARPSVRFVSGEQSLAVTYDLVFAQGSLQYIKNWREQLMVLALRSAPWLYLTRVLVLKMSPTVVVHQTTSDDQFAFWCWNEAELLDFAASIGLVTVQTFQFRDAYAPIAGVDELPGMCGYLFRREGQVAR